MSALPRPLLAYDRVAANRRNTRILLVTFGVIAFPVAAWVITYLAHVLWMFVGIAVMPDAFQATDGEEVDYAFHLTLLAACAVISLLFVILATLYLFHRASARLVRVTGAHEVTGDDEPQFRRKVENLCIGVGLPVPRLFVVESEAANAFSTGLSPDQASLVVTSGLLTRLTSMELDGVLAHELSKIGNYDTRLNVALAAVLGMLRLPSALLVGFFRLLFRVHVLVGAGALLYAVTMAFFTLLGTVWIYESEQDLGLRAVLLVGILLPIHAFIGAPLLGLILAQAVSRARVFAADADAILLTRSPGALATALGKIEAAGRLEKANSASAGLFFANPRASDSFFWEVFFDTHPSPKSRIAVVAAMSAGVSPLDIQVGPAEIVPSTHLSKSAIFGLGTEEWTSLASQRNGLAKRL